MTYSLWSRGRLLGHSDLRWGSGPDDDGQRFGFFECAEGAQALVDIAAAVEKAESEMVDAHDMKTAAADLVAAMDRCAALELEIRGPDGRTLDTSEIEIRDTVYVFSRVERPIDDAELLEDLSDGAIELDDDDPIERELLEQRLEMEMAQFEEQVAWSPDDDPMRYMLSVRFTNRADFPPAIED